MKQVKKSQFGSTHRKTPEKEFHHDKSLCGTDDFSGTQVLVSAAADMVSREVTGAAIDSLNSNIPQSEDLVPFVHSQIKRFTVADIQKQADQW